MKKITLLGILFIIVVAFIACAKSEETKVLRIGHDSQENSALHKAFVFLQEQVQESEDLSLEVEIFPAAQLGNAKELFDTVQQGNLEMTAPATVLLSSSIPEFNVFDVFYLFDSAEHAYRSYDGPAGQALLDVLEPLGMHGFGYMEVGMRSMSNSRAPIINLDDLKGLKIRAASNPLQIIAWESAGAAPIPMAFGEIFTSLQQGLLDGQESAVGSMYTQRFFEVQKYISLTEHIYTNYLLVMNKVFWDSLREIEQTALEAIAKKTIKKQRELAMALSEEYLERMKSEGIEVNSVSAEFKQELAQRLNSPTRDKVRELTGTELYDFVVDEVDKVR